MLKQLWNDIEIWRAVKLAQKTRKLHMAPPSICTFNFKIEGIDGKVRNEYRQMTHSYTRNFLNHMCMGSILEQHKSLYSTYADGSLRCRQTSGTLSLTSEIHATVLRTVSTVAGNVAVAFNGSLNSNAIGIVVGTDNTAESIDDYRMEALVPDGTAAGQLQYQLQIQGAASFNAVNKMWSKEWTRSFHNIGGGSITIREIGCYVQISSVSTIQVLCTIRDVLSSPITLNTGEKLTITYTFNYIVSN